MYCLSGLPNTHDESGDKLHEHDDGDGQTMRNMKTLNSYLVHHTSPEASQSPNISSGTLDALENAEKLVQEARQTIIEASYSVPTLDFTAERQPTATDVDENELYIRDVVTAQFQKANGRTSSNTIFSSNARTNLEFNSPSRVRRIIPRETMERRRGRYHDTKKKMETCKECLMSKDENKLRGKMSSGAYHGREGARVDIKPQLSLRNVERLDLFPTDTKSKTLIENVKIYQFKHDSANRATVGESLIDAAVQTSLCESTSKESRVNTKQSTELPVDNGQSSLENQISHQNTIENSAMQPGTSGQANGEEKPVEEKKTKEPKGSFFDFLQYMAQSEGNENDNAANNGEEGEDLIQEPEHSEDEVFDGDFDHCEIVLDSPDTKEIDEMIKRLDIKMKQICAEIDEFNHKYFPVEPQWGTDDPIVAKYVDKNTSPITVPKNVEPPAKKTNLKIQMDREKCSDARASVKFLLRPRSRIPSTDSEESSDTMLPPARYSTPLNNYRPVDIPAGNIEVKNSRDIMDEYFIPIIEPDMKNDASKVVMTKNKFSSVSSIDEKFQRDGKNNDAVNINVDPHSVVENTKENTAQDTPSNIPVTSHLSHESEKKCKSPIDNSEKRVDNEDVNETDIEYEIEIGEQSLSIAISSDKKSTTINSQETSDHEVESNGIENPHDSCATLKNECGNLNLNGMNKRGKEETKSIDISNKTNLTPPELSTRDRTSLDISAIYSASFETSDITKIKSISRDIIDVDNDMGEKIMEENNIVSHSTKGTIDIAGRIEKPIEISSIDPRKIETDSYPAQLSKSSNSNQLQSDEKIGNGRNTINISSSTTSSLRKVSPINSLSSSQQSNGFKKKFSADDCYSEGELFLPSSCSYSLGEIRIAERAQQNNTNKNLMSNCPMTLISSISTSSVQSPGEIQETDIESNFSIEKEH